MALLMATSRQVDAGSSLTVAACRRPEQLLLKLGKFGGRFARRSWT
jgi:hypothetical protein